MKPSIPFITQSKNFTRGYTQSENKDWGSLRVFQRRSCIIKIKHWVAGIELSWRWREGGGGRGREGRKGKKGSRSVKWASGHACDSFPGRMRHSEWIHPSRMHNTMSLSRDDEREQVTVGAHLVPTPQPHSLSSSTSDHRYADCSKLYPSPSPALGQTPLETWP